MKRQLFAAAVGSALAVTMAGTVAATHGGDVEKPLCADIMSGGGQLLPDASGTYEFNFALQTAGRCGGVVYTVYVFDTQAECESGTGVPIATLTERGTDATGGVAFVVPGLSQDDSVWVYATTTRGQTTFDVAPDAGTGCAEVTDDPPAGGKIH